MLKRLEVAQLVRRTRNPDNERQVIVSLTKEGRASQMKGGCLADALLDSTGETDDSMAKVNEGVRRLRDRIYDHLGGWVAPV